MREGGVSHVPHTDIHDDTHTLTHLRQVATNIGKSDDYNLVDKVFIHGPSHDDGLLAIVLDRIEHRQALNNSTNTNQQYKKPAKNCPAAF